MVIEGKEVGLGDGSEDERIEGVTDGDDDENIGKGVGINVGKGVG